MFKIFKATTPENEFERCKAAHKYAILRYKLERYYKDLEEGQVLIPDFMRIGERPQDRARQDIINLLATPDGIAKFDRLYEKAYQELAEVLP